jgi:hypothetical protein
MLTLSDRDVRAYLRGATAAKLLWGWNNYENAQGERMWTATPDSADPVIHDSEGIRVFCEMVKEAGIEPRYIPND